MNTNLTIDQRIDMAAKAHDEGRIIQNTWRKERDGREFVCALAAFGPDINSTEDCPADLMPRWLAALVPTLDDGMAATDVAWFSGELIARARRWRVLDNDAWERVRIGFLIAGIRLSVASAAQVQPDPAPAYWQQVVDGCEGVISALSGISDMKAAARAAEAAAEAAWAAWAVQAAARAAAWAVQAAARAARAAAEAEVAWAAAEVARAARVAARAAEAAAEAAYRSLAETLFKMIDAEVEAVA